MRNSQLTSMYERPGPFASVTLDVGHHTESGVHEHELRVRSAGEELASLGAADEVVRAVTDRLAERVEEPSPVGRVVVATLDEVVFDELLHTQLDSAAVTWDALPDITTWVAEQDRDIPFVLALVDHVGGNVATFHSEIPEAQEETTAGGETFHVQLVPAGGWSALRYQHETENVWHRNAEAVAAEIGSRIRAGHRLVLLAGDPKSRADVTDRLSGTPATIVQLESGGRAEDGGDEALQQEIRQALLDQAVSRRMAVAHTLKDRLGRDQAVATGVRDVADAFVRGQVETLLLDPAQAAEHSLTLAEHPGLTLGPAPHHEPLRADQALIAAAALTDADITVSPSSTLGGAPVAALLRW